MKHEQAIGYSYDFNKDDYTLYSRNNVIDLNVNFNNIKERTDIDTLFKKHEYFLSP